MTRRATRARHDELLALLRTGVDGVEALAERLDVSPSTVRRDLTRLQDDGRIARTYGGALVRDTFQERSFSESARIHQEAKEAVAAAALGLVAPGASVFVDAGTTCLALARRLHERGPLTVVTRGLEAAVLLAHEGVDVTMLGGAVQPLSHGVVGPLTSVGLERLAFDVAFLGADAVDPVRGLGEPTVEETYVKERAAQRADRVVVLADASKAETESLPAWLAFGASWTWVTDAAADTATVAAFEARGLAVLTAG